MFFSSRTDHFVATSILAFLDAQHITVMRYVFIFEPCHFPVLNKCTSACTSAQFYQPMFFWFVSDQVGKPKTGFLVTRLILMF